MANNALPHEKEERAARRRSRAMERKRAQRLFAEVNWPVERTVAWIAYRDPALIEKNWRHSQLYDHPKSKMPRLRDQTPVTTLLRALQSDHLRAIGKGGTEVPPEAWAHVTAARQAWPDVRLRSKDVLAVWPVPGRRKYRKNGELPEPKHASPAAATAKVGDTRGAPRHKRDLVKRAITALQQAKTLPALPKQRDTAINDWLRQQGLMPKGEIGRSTINRALKEIPVEK